jgi:hypothetical protein
MAFCRSEGWLTFCCASTTLAATIYENCITAHSLFNFPVVDDLERDQQNGLRCNMKTQRIDMLTNAKVIIWDEFVTNHKELYESARQILNVHNPKLIWICTGDFHQCLPIVKGKMTFPFYSLIFQQHIFRLFCLH